MMAGQVVTSGVLVAVVVDDDDVAQAVVNRLGFHHTMMIWMTMLSLLS
jgi:hypothetical protein